MVIHEKHHRVGERSADLEAETPAADRDKHRGAPTVGSAAASHSLAVVASEYEGCLLLSWNDDNALRLFQKVTGNALIGCRHDFMEDSAGFLGTSDVIFAIRRQSG